MAKKSSLPASPSLSVSPRICFERIIPDELDSERMVRRALRRMILERDGDTLDPGIVQSRNRLALIRSKQWQPGQELRCRFLHGSPTIHKKVEAIAHQWEKHANIKFKFIKTGEAEIRIAFSGNGSWSAVGRDALNTAYFPRHQPTMNFGWLDSSTPTEEYQRVVLHEFGHALGCVHEHQTPKFDRRWNRAKVLEYFSGSPNYWSVEQIEQNILRKYSSTGVAMTDYDPDSIMLYYFDGILFSDGKGATNKNFKLSRKDISFIGELYS